MSKPRDRYTVELVKFGYGIVGPDNKAYWDEACVCEDGGVLNAEVVSHLNRGLEPRQRFREVTLYYKRRASRRKS